MFYVCSQCDKRFDNRATCESHEVECCKHADAAYSVCYPGSDKTRIVGAVRHCPDCGQKRYIREDAVFEPVAARLQDRMFPAPPSDPYWFDKWLKGFYERLSAFVAAEMECQPDELPGEEA